MAQRRNHKENSDLIRQTKPAYYIIFVMFGFNWSTLLPNW
jgi:hypothetical protein